MNILSKARSRSYRIRQCIARIFMALCIITVGVGYLGNYISFLPWEHFTLFFHGWGTLFLIIPAIYMLIRRPFSTFWVLCLLLGCLILLATHEAYSFGVCAAIATSILIIVIGLRFLFSPLIRRMRRKRFAKHWTLAGTDSFVADNDSNATVSFANRTVDMSGQCFTSATITCSFGELNYNLQGALVQDNSVMDVTCSFGEITIRIPNDVRIEVQAYSSFAEVNNMHATPSDPNAPVMYINVNCSFGDVNIQ